MILIRPCIPVFRWDTGTRYITLESDDCCFAVSHNYALLCLIVLWSVGLSLALTLCQPCKNSWNDQVAICVPDSGGASEPHIKSGPDAIMGRSNFEGNRQTIVKYRDTPRSSVQRRWTDQGAVWVVDSCGPKASCITWEIQIPHGKGQFWWIGAPIVKCRHFLP